MKRIIAYLLLYTFVFSSSYAQKLELELPKGIPTPNNVRIQPYHNGFKSKASMMEKGAVPSTFYLDFQQTVSQPAGLYELLIDTYRPMPFVLHGQKTIVSKPTIEQLKTYSVAVSDIENEALAYFLGHYANHLNRRTSLQENLKMGQAIGNKQISQDFLTSFVSYQNEMKANMDTLKNRYPNTYTALYLANYFGETRPDSLMGTLKHIQQHFFDTWNFSNPITFQNPVIAGELDFYFTYFGALDGDMMAGIATLLTHPDLMGKLAFTEPLMDIISQILLKNHDPKAEEYTLYMDETFGNACGLAPADITLRNTMPQRFKRMKEGATFPDLNLTTFDGENHLSLKEILAQQPYTLLYFWQSNCEHCTAGAAGVEEFAEENADDLHTVAIAIGREKEEIANYVANLKKTGRERNRGWTECWEKEGINSEQMNKIYIKGTPTFVLLNPQGKVLAAATGLEKIKTYFTKKDFTKN